MLEATGGPHFRGVRFARLGVKDLSDLIDTTEMYLKTIFELEEDGIVPLRARIVERLGHSGPTVSQTIARMERDNLVVVESDRRLDLTQEGRDVANEVMRKHRLAECLLVRVIGLDWVEAHDEACRWEHVMSGAVETRLPALLGDPTRDPYGNPVPGSAVTDENEVSVDVLAKMGGSEGHISRIGEHIQAHRPMLVEFQEAGLMPGTPVKVEKAGETFRVCNTSGQVTEGTCVVLPALFASHLFIR